MSYLECTNATATFGSLIAVDHINLSIEEGTTVGIGGPNGAGKTTFLDLISGLIPLADGDIKLGGKSLKGLKAYERSRLGVARTFQLNAGFDSMTVLENVLTAIVFGNNSTSGRGIMYSKTDLERAYSLIEEFEMADIGHLEVGGLATLNRKKLMVMTALASEPKLLLFDEPVGGLTPGEIDQFIELILGLKKQGRTIVFIEHVMRFLTTVSDRALIMHHGSMIFDGKPSEIAHDATVTEVYLGSEAKQMKEASNG